MVTLADRTIARRLLIVGGRGGTNIGDSMERAAGRLGIATTVADANLAMKGPALLRKCRWRLCGRKPLRLEQFSDTIVRLCEEYRPDLLLVIGITPPEHRCLQAAGKLGIIRAAFLTDDPWSPYRRAPWFLKALSEYDFVFSPREANLADLRGITGATIKYLQFGYDPDLFFPVSRSADFAADVMFAGGADADRVPYIGALVKSGLKVDLYGSYWERYPETRHLTRGQADVAVLREAVANARVSLCLVRRANRDGHSMRTFEVPAMRGCAIMEDTAEHVSIFGEDGRSVLYFRTIDEMRRRVAWLLEHPEERERLADEGHRLVTGGANTYQDRLASILRTVGKAELIGTASAC